MRRKIVHVADGSALGASIRRPHTSARRGSGLRQWGSDLVSGGRRGSFSDMLSGGLMPSRGAEVRDRTAARPASGHALLRRRDAAASLASPQGPASPSAQGSTSETLRRHVARRRVELHLWWATTRRRLARALGAARARVQRSPAW